MSDQKPEDIKSKLSRLMSNNSKVIQLLLDGLKPGVPQTKRNELIEAFKPLASKTADK